MKKILLHVLLVSVLFNTITANSQVIEMWDKTHTGSVQDEKTKWFRDAKFGLFIHWGLFAQPAGVWKQKNYYGISEWLMFRGKIPVAEYSKIKEEFNPVKFNAGEWAKMAKDAGVKYMVITSKHHEGFAMFDTKYSDFKITNTPFGRDPMKELSDSCREQGLKFGFYYSQFLDWHEKNGGGNNWDFVDSLKDYKSYYQSKSIPQIKELLSNYGPLGLIWFDMPGGLSKDETQSLIDDARRIQPNCLLSSRVGQGLGDFTDFGDAEVPATVVKGPWEAVFTHNDSWGYSQFDFNFKSAKEIVRLLANVASKGGNLMLNVGPKADGTIPKQSVSCLKKVGAWLKVNGESIYGTTYGPVAPQPWGVTTKKEGKLFLHIMQSPGNRKIELPSFNAKINRVYFLSNGKNLTYGLANNRLSIKLPSAQLPDDYNTVIVVSYSGQLADSYASAPIPVSLQYNTFPLDVIRAKHFGASRVEPVTFSHYFGDWKHVTCATNMKTAADSLQFDVDFLEAGDYKISMEYSCSAAGSGQEGILKVNGASFHFQTLETGNYDAWKPLPFIKHPIAEVRVKQPLKITITIMPNAASAELFKLSRVVIEPVK